jgi:hypothetical protein
MNVRRLIVASGLVVLALVAFFVVNSQVHHHKDRVQFERQVVQPMGAIAAVLELQAAKRPLQLMSISELNAGVRARASWAKNPWTSGPLRIVDLGNAKSAEPGDFVFGYDVKKGSYVLGAINPDKELVDVTPIMDFTGGGE